MTTRCILAMAAVATVLTALPAAAAVVDPVISSNEPLPFPRNAQNEPALAVDRSAKPRGPLLVAGGNDYRDQPPCSGAGGCGFAPGIGISGLYLSDNGVSWLQSSAGLRTVPNFDVKRWSYGDPALASGPRPKGSSFAWANGVRFYYASLAATSGPHNRVITVSYSDPGQRARVALPRWSRPITISGRTPSADKPAIWADDAAHANRGFGHVYACWTAFASAAASDTGGQIMLSRSLNGGRTWSTPKQLSRGATPGAHACTIRSDSRGTVYVFWRERRQAVASLDTIPSGVPCAKLFRSAIVLARSQNGVAFAPPRVITAVAEAGAWDKAQEACTVDGVAGARTNSFPAVDIANGAPLGAGPSTIALATSEGPSGQILIRTSHTLGASWSVPLAVSRPNDAAAAFPAVALAPNGAWLYVVYSAFLQPWSSSPLSGARSMQAVLRVTSLTTLESSPSTAAWGEVDGATGDARASAGYEGGDRGAGKPIAAEFLGDYNAIVATGRAAFAAWTDVSAASDCGPVDSYRQVVANGKGGDVPNLVTACPPEKSGGLTTSFGNTTLCGATISAGYASTARETACASDQHP